MTSVGSTVNHYFYGKKLQTPTHSFAVPFLRGYGSQTATFDQGLLKGTRPTTVTSGPLGEVQGYASKTWCLRGFPLSITEDLYHTTHASMEVPNQGWLGRWNITAMNAWSGAERDRNTNTASVFNIDDPMDKPGYLWLLQRPPKRYELVGHGGEYADYSLRELDDSDSGYKMFAFSETWTASNKVNGPTDDNEVRPSNIAVRFFVKAR